MRGKILLIVSAVAAFHVSAAVSFSEKTENGIRDKQGVITSLPVLENRLAGLEDYYATAKYGVLLPSADEEVVYEINLQSSPSDDGLSPCNYFISWSVDTPSGKSEGFNTYWNGNHFRYSDERLQEYHYDNDSTSFLETGGSVQRQARFANLLPAFLSEEIQKITTDSAFTYKFMPDTRYSGTPAVRIDAVETMRGYTVREMSYIFDAVSSKPLHISIESNPGAISEQSITIDYKDATGDRLENYSEDTLIGLYPEVFERFRSGNFRLENLPGTAMPQFSFPTLEGGRYTHLRGDKFEHPTVIVVIDPDVASAQRTVDDIRHGVNSMPAAVDIIWANNSRHTDSIEQLIGKSSVGETTLVGAGSIIRDCGITAFPAIIFVGTDGIIKSVHIGANKNLEEIVMQKTAVM